MLVFFSFWGVTSQNNWESLIVKRFLHPVLYSSLFLNWPLVNIFHRWQHDSTQKHEDSPKQQQHSQCNKWRDKHVTEGRKESVTTLYGIPVMNVKGQGRIEMKLQSPPCWCCSILPNNWSRWNMEPFYFSFVPEVSRWNFTWLSISRRVTFIFIFA